MAVLILSAIFVLVMIGLSIRANARFRQEKTLPMQWRLSRSEPLARSVNWSAPRVVALSFTPSLAIGVLALFNVAAMTMTPRPGQEGMLFPSLIFIGSMFGGRLREGAESYAKDLGQRYSPVRLMCSHPNGETWASRSGAIWVPLAARVLTTSPSFMVFQNMMMAASRFIPAMR